MPAQKKTSALPNAEVSEAQPNGSNDTTITAESQSLVLSLATVRKVKSDGTAGLWHTESTTWPDLVSRLRAMPVRDKATAPGFLLGTVTEGRRKSKETVLSRSGAALDYDQGDGSAAPKAGAWLSGHHVAGVTYETHRSTPEAPRWRVVLPFSRDVTPAEYRRITHWLETGIGADGLDEHTHQHEQCTFFPTAPDEVTAKRFVHTFTEISGQPLDVDEVLAQAPEIPQTAPVATGAHHEQTGEVASQDEVARVYDRTLAYLDDMCGWPEGYRENGLGWDTGMLTDARLLAQCSLADPAGHPMVRAEQDFYDHAPSNETVGSRVHAHKWHEGLRSAKERGALLATDSRPEDDFDAVDLPSEDGTGKPASSWLPLSLNDYLDGTYKPPVPAILPRTDGMCLFYPGRTHSVAAEPEAGKSMVLQHAELLELQQGHDVLHIDFEDSPDAVVERLLAMGADVGGIRDHYCYLQPEAVPDSTLTELLDSREFTLAVIDGVSESMAVLGTIGGAPNEDAIRWADMLPRRIVNGHSHPAVVQIDHVTKSRDTRGRYAIGAQAKLSGLTGAAYLASVEAPLGRGLLGEVSWRVAKDKPGFIRGKSGPSDNGTQEAARITIDGRTPGRITVTVQPPKLSATVGLGGQMEAAVLAYLGMLPEDDWATMRDIRTNVTGQATAIDNAVSRLKAHGQVEQKVRGRAILTRLVPIEFDDLGDSDDLG